MSYGQKKFKTPMELHKTLGNEHQLGVAKRNEFRRRMKLELRAEARNNPVLQRRLEEDDTKKFQQQQHKGPAELALDSTMLQRQLQLEIEIERLRSTIDSLRTDGTNTAATAATMPTSATTTTTDAAPVAATAPASMQSFAQEALNESEEEPMQQIRNAVTAAVEEINAPTAVEVLQEADKSLATARIYDVESSAVDSTATAAGATSSTLRDKFNREESALTVDSNGTLSARSEQSSTENFTANISATGKNTRSDTEASAVDSPLGMAEATQTSNKKHRHHRSSGSNRPHHRNRSKHRSSRGRRHHRRGSGGSSSDRDRDDYSNDDDDNRRSRSRSSSRSPSRNKSSPEAATVDTPITTPAAAVTGGQVPTPSSVTSAVAAGATTAPARTTYDSPLEAVRRPGPRFPDHPSSVRAAAGGSRTAPPSVAAVTASTAAEIDRAALVSLMLSPYRDPHLQITQSFHQQRYPHQPQQQPLQLNSRVVDTSRVAARSSGSSSGGGVFVLPCAPNLGVSNLLQQQQQLLSSSSNTTAEVGEDSLFSQWNGPYSDSSQLLQQQPSIQDQICRFAEIRSLFTLPTSLSEDETLLLNSLHQLQQHDDAPVSLDLSLLCDIQHDGKVEEKRRVAFEKHKKRHEKARHPPRRFPLQQLQRPQQQQQSSTNRSPRSKIHQARYPSYSADSEYFRAIVTTATTDGTTVPATTAATTTIATAASDAAVADAPDHHRRDSASPIARVSDSSSSKRETGGSASGQQQQQRNGTPETANSSKFPQPAGSRKPWLRSAPSTLPSATTTTATVDDFNTRSTRAATAGSASEKVSSSSDATTTVASASAAPSLVTATVNAPGSTGAASAEAVLSSNQEVEEREMTVTEFKAAHDRLKKKMSRVVQQAVSEQMKADCQSQHFTRRTQSLLMAKAKKPLANKIEKRLNEKMQELQRELAALRASKLNIVQQQDRRRRGHTAGSDGSEEDDEGYHRDDDARLHGNDGWHTQNELQAAASEQNRKSEIDVAKIGLNFDLKHNMEALFKEKQKPNLQPHGEATTSVDDTAYTSTSATAAAAVVVASSSDHGHDDGAASEMSDFERESALADALEEEKPKKKKLTKAERLMGFTEDGAPPQQQQQQQQPRPPEQSSRMFGLFGSKNANGSNAAPAAVVGSAASSSRAFSRLIGGSKKHTGSKKTKGKLSPLKTIRDDNISGSGDDGEEDAASVASNDSKRSKRSNATSRRAGSSSGSRSPTRRSSEARLNALVAGGSSGRPDSAGIEGGGGAAGAGAVRMIELELSSEADNLAVLLDVKATIKQELKQWERNFERRVGRPANDADKSAIQSRFLAYRSASNQVKEQTQLVKSLEKRLKEAR